MCLESGSSLKEPFGAAVATCSEGLRMAVTAPDGSDGKGEGLITRLVVVPGVPLQLHYCSRG